MRKITIVIWDTFTWMLRGTESSRTLDLSIYSNHDFDTRTGAMDDFRKDAESSDLILLYHTSQSYWYELDQYIANMGGQVPVISMGADAMDFRQTTVEPRIALDCYRYLNNSGPENCERALRYIRREIFGEDLEVLPPLESPWHGIIHPDHEGVFQSLDEYLDWYGPKVDEPWVGIMMSRSAYITDGCNVEFDLLRRFEAAGAKVILVFTTSIHDDTKKALNIPETVERYFCRDGRTYVDAIVKTMMFLLSDSEIDGERVTGTQYLKSTDVPVFQPVIPSNISKETFDASPGLSADIPWAIALPEFDGVIEPMIIGFTREYEDEERNKRSIPERAQRLTDRVMARIQLRRKPNSEKKVVFLLNNYPCAGAEANIGSATLLDVHRSMVNILRAMKDAGYTIGEIPEDGKQFIDTILQRRAISDFRWTSVTDIDGSGGVIHRMSVDEYRSWFDTLSPTVREQMVSAWGEPPGEGMVLGGDILITGVSYGNVVVGVQPKRGCYGSRCDGSVCKILHDPHIPPTHQYLATYHYYEDVWGADAVVHVGTHGNLEFLPGKGTGMTSDCYPDIAIGKKPHIYIYNSDNPSEGAIAKRRSYATLIDHMQTVMSASGLYGELEVLDDLLAQYQTARHDPSLSHQLKHLILDTAERADLDLGLTHDTDIEDIVRICHDELSRIRDSRMNVGLHVLGENPQGRERAEFIDSILRYDTGTGSLNSLVAECFGESLDSMYSDRGGYCESMDMSNGQAIALISERSREIIARVVSGQDILDAANAEGVRIKGFERRFEYFSDAIADISRNIDASDEIGSFLHALDGGYTEAGPSGVITRGRADILPTGRNFYCLDPNRIPTRAAARVGVMLAENTVKKYIEDEGILPETIAFYLMSSDILISDGEALAQILHLMGARPVWSDNGRVTGYEILSLEELGRPRIDVTIRTSGILRDNFTNCIDMVDSVVRDVSALDEPSDMNFVRKHTLESVASGIDAEDATARIFGCPPGTYASGVNIAVYSSAWKTEEDLAQIYIAGNGYAYGNGRDGKAAHEQFSATLSTVSVTYNKISSDEHDLLGCCCYFSNIGGLTAASRQMSGKDVRMYYGDTREPADINVHTLADEIRRVVRTKLLNPRWIDGMKEHGYVGAADMMKRIGRVYGFEATTQQVDDWIFDDIADTFVNNDEMRRFYQENNPYALEEISRRLLEAEQRGLWDADEKTLAELKEHYLEIESWLEGISGEGEYQGGSVDIITPDDAEEWNRNMSEAMSKARSILHGRRG